MGYCSWLINTHEHTARILGQLCVDVCMLNVQRGRERDKYSKPETGRIERKSVPHESEIVTAEK